MSENFLSGMKTPKLTCINCLRNTNLNKHDILVYLHLSKDGGIVWMTPSTKDQTFFFKPMKQKRGQFNPKVYPYSIYSISLYQKSQ